jgi:hypothetical protein
VYVDALLDVGFHTINLTGGRRVSKRSEAEARPSMPTCCYDDVLVDVGSQQVAIAPPITAQSLAHVEETRTRTAHPSIPHRATNEEGEHQTGHATALELGSMQPSGTLGTGARAGQGVQRATYSVDPAEGRQPS